MIVVFVLYIWLHCGGLHSTACAIRPRCRGLVYRLGGGRFSDTYVAHWRGKRVAAKRITVGIHRHQIQYKTDNSDWIVSNVASLRFLSTSLLFRIHIKRINWF